MNCEDHCVFQVLKKGWSLIWVDGDFCCLGDHVGYKRGWWMKTIIVDDRKLAMRYVHVHSSLVGVILVFWKIVVK
jgi:hypothetical protein